MNIDWNNLEMRMSSKELSFESFNFQIAWLKFSAFGDFEYDYNTPGAEFYLTLGKDYPELGLNSGAILGWQAKFWVNRNDMNNTGMDSSRRTELSVGLKKALAHKPNLNVWIICTPGQIVPDARTKLEKDLHFLKPDLRIIFWNKPVYEAYYLQSPDAFNSIFAHYFGSQFIGYEFIQHYTKMRINRLGDKFDTDLYITTSIDKEIDLILDYRKIMSALHLAIHDWQNDREYSAERCKELIAKIETIGDYKAGLSNLLKCLLDLAEKLYATLATYKGTKNVLNALNKLFVLVDNGITSWNESINQLQLCNKSDSEERNSEENNFNHEIHNHFKYFTIICDLYDKFYQSEIHVFGKAGYGKTNLACAICRESLNRGIPSILILASEIRAESNLASWIVESLQSKHDLATLLGILDNYGFLKQKKIAFVIDGLNEKYPTARVWQAELTYLRQMVKKYRNLLLITTSRESYVEEIFNKTSYKEVLNNYYLEGFLHHNLNLAIKKYFHKYAITVNNSDYDKSIFQNPLLLKMFCLVHKGMTFALYPTNIFDTIENYYKFIINKVSGYFPGQSPIMKKKIEDNVSSFGLNLLNHGSRCLDYLTEFFDIFDPGFQPSHEPQALVSEKILDEGLFIKRDMIKNQEVVEFTYDFMGGYSIARAMAFRNDDPEQIWENLKNRNYLGKVIDLSTGVFLHPFSEDILKNLTYFIRKKTGKRLHDVVKLDSVLELEFSMLESVNLSEEEKLTIVNELISSPNKQLITALLESTISNVTDKNNYCGMEIVLDIIQELPAREIDLYWSECIRNNSAKIFKYLDGFLMNSPDTGKTLENCGFISCLLSSSDRLLRDTATKCLVNIGEMFPDILFRVYKRMENVSDLYITERLVAALCGAILRKGTGFKEKCVEIAEYLENKFFTQICTSHLLILDYVDTILRYVSHFCGYKQLYFIDKEQLRDWQQDEEAFTQLSDKEPATWGYGPIRMDFAKYIIGSHITSLYGSTKAPSLKEAIAMIIWRMKNLGYDAQTFVDIDRECSKTRHDYSRHDHSGSIERYGKKYSWIAFFELYGQLMLKGVLKTEEPNSFRVSSIDIDPTFPVLPRKEQLITKCFLPRKTDDLQAWIENVSNEKLFEDIYLYEVEHENWILLNCKHHQQNEKKVRIDINVDAMLIPNDKSIEALNVLNTPEGEYDCYLEEYYYLFNGEIPWKESIITTDENLFLSDRAALIFISPYAYFTWESYHSRTNNTGSFPFLIRAICDEFNMKYNNELLSFFVNDEPCTIFYHDSFSHYYFIKEKYIKDYLRRKKLSLIWCEHIYKYGNFDFPRVEELNPSTNILRTATLYE